MLLKKKKAMVSILLVVVALGSLSAASMGDAKKSVCNYARVNPADVNFSTERLETQDGYEVYNLAFKVDDTSWQFVVDKNTGDIVKGSSQEMRPYLVNGQQPAVSQDKAKRIASNEISGDQSNFYCYGIDTAKVKNDDCWKVSINDGDGNDYNVYVNMVTGRVAKSESV